MASTRSAAATGFPTRHHLECLIQEVIDALDLLDPDCDLEENGDLEPSLGPDHRGQTDLELDQCDDEPSLGSLDCAINQEDWSHPHNVINSMLDLEHDDCDDEDGGDAEPNGDERDWNGDEYDGTMAEDDWLWDGNRPAVPMSESERRSLVGASGRLEEITSRKALSQELCT